MTVYINVRRRCSVLSFPLFSFPFTSFSSLPFAILHFSSLFFSYPCLSSLCFSFLFFASLFFSLPLISLLFPPSLFFTILFFLPYAFLSFLVLHLFPFLSFPLHLSPFFFSTKHPNRVQTPDSSETNDSAPISFTTHSFRLVGYPAISCIMAKENYKVALLRRCFSVKLPEMQLS